MRRILVIILSVIFAVPTFAQKNMRPQWIGHTPSGTGTYYFVEVRSDASSSLDGARTYSLKDLTANVERTDKVNVNEIFSDKSRQSYSNGNVNFLGADDYSLELKVEGTAVPIRSRRIDEYAKTVNRGGLTVLDYSALYAVERKGCRADFSGISVSNKYGISTMWRAILPGWGQMYKGSYTKGGLIMGGTVCGVAGIIVSESIRNDYVNKANNTRSTSEAQQYQSRINDALLARNISIGFLAALYVYNIIDAFVAPGARRVVVAPVAYGNNSFGVGGSVTF